MIRSVFHLWPVLLVAVMVGAQTKPPASMIVWSESRKLTWQDFQGIVPEKRTTDANTDHRIWHYAPPHCPSTKLHPAVLALFDPQKSWVIDTMKKDLQLLHHEQLHFDLAEVYARILRKKLNAFKVPCGYNKQVIDAQIQLIAENVIKELEIEEGRYDVETKHGLDKRAQTEWEKKVKGMLEASPRPLPSVEG